MFAGQRPAMGRNCPAGPGLCGRDGPASVSNGMTSSALASDDAGAPAGRETAGPPRHFRSTDRIDRLDWLLIVGISVVWAILAVLVNPLGDFPLNDDWAYGLPVKWLVEGGGLRFTGWQAHPLIAQVLWGGLFALPAGFSFTALRCSTLVIAAVGLAATYLSARLAGLARRDGVAIALLLLVNPLYISLSHTFMTDIPNLALGMVAIALLIHGVRHERTVTFWAGWLMVLLASLIRQPTLAIAIAMCIALAVKDGLGRRWLLRAVIPAVLVIFAVVTAYPRLIQSTVGLPAGYYGRANSMLRLVGMAVHLDPSALKPTVTSVTLGFMNLGLWMLPLLLVLWPRLTRVGARSRAPAILAGVGTCAVLITARLWARGHLMPMAYRAGNLLLDFGTGVRPLGGETPGAPRTFWLIVTAASAFGAVLLLFALLGAVVRLAKEPWTDGSRASWITVLLLSTVVVSYGPASLNFGPWYDRFTLMLLPLLPVVIARSFPAAGSVGGWTGRFSSGLAGALALLYLGFAVASTHDYLDWNRVRWRACGELVSKEGVSAAALDCGFEFNNLLDSSVPGAHRGGGLLADRSGARYAVGYGPVEGFKVLRTMGCHPWLPYAIQGLSILERVGR